MQMSDTLPRPLMGFCRSLLFVAVSAGCVLEARAGGFFRNAAVGGISIDADGVVREPTIEATTGSSEGTTHPTTGSSKARPRARPWRVATSWGRSSLVLVPADRVASPLVRDQDRAQ